MHFQEPPKFLASAPALHVQASATFPPAVALATGAAFYRQHLWTPLLVFTALSAALMGMGVDQHLADWVYAWEGHAWTLQSNRITQGLIHVGGRQASKFAWCAVALLWLSAWSYRPLSHWRRPLAYLLLSTLLATLLVSGMKRWTHMDCPWDLVRYGGGKAYYGLFAWRPDATGKASCFPAGHASAGYAWVALYFFFLSTAPRWRWWGLGIGLAAGMVFGIGQQLRGAHFLSHDVWALMVCWLSALLLHRLMLVRKPLALHAGAAS